MSLKTIRRLAAKIWKSGESRVRILDAKKASEALTTEDVKQLIAENVVVLLPQQGVSRGRARDVRERKRKGRKSGPGSRRGAAFAGMTAKEKWMRQVRAQRRLLRSFKKTISTENYRKAYRRIKGNAFLTKKRLEEYVKGLSAQTPGKGETS